MKHYEEVIKEWKTIPQDAQIKIFAYSLRDTDVFDRIQDGLSEKIAKIFLELMLEAGTDITIEGNEAIEFAAFHRKPELVKILIEAGADVNAEKSLFALNFVAGLGCIEIVNMLLEAGADVNANYEGSTALMSAVANRQVETIEILIEAGADVNANNQEELKYAARKGFVSIVKILVAAGAKITADVLKQAFMSKNPEVIEFCKEEYRKRTI